MGSRNRQRATFQKRQREMQRQERQSQKRARRQGRVEADDRSPAPPHSHTGPLIGAYPSEIGRYPGETDDEPATEQPPASTGS